MVLVVLQSSLPFILRLSLTVLYENMRLAKAFAIGASMISSVEALPSRAQSFARRQVTELRDEYDFIIVGGGTAGLTAAHRVSAALPKSGLKSNCFSGLRYRSYPV